MTIPQVATHLCLWVGLFAVAAVGLCLSACAIAYVVDSIGRFRDRRILRLVRSEVYDIDRWLATDNRCALVCNRIIRAIGAAERDGRVLGEDMASWREQVWRAETHEDHIKKYAARAANQCAVPHPELPVQKEPHDAR